MGQAPARAMGSGGRFKEGVRGLARPWLPLLIKDIKASAFNKTFKEKSFSKISKIYFYFFLLPSSSKSFLFTSKPPAYPLRLPSLPITLWQGIINS